MANTYKNKVVLSDGTILIDLTGITVTAQTLAEGVTALDASGAPITGTMEDGNNLEYGLIDATSSLIGVGTIDNMTIE